MLKTLTKFSLIKSKNILIFSNIQKCAFATKMRGMVTKNTKDNPGRRLGIKKYGGEEVTENQIIARQRGFKWKVGENVHYGRDHTIHASKEGKVYFTRDQWSKKKRVRIHIVEQEVPNRKVFNFFR